MMYSLLAVVLVVLLVPAALGMVHSLNDAYSNEYITSFDAVPYKSFSAETGAGSDFAAEVLYLGENSTGSWRYTELGDDIFYDTNGSIDTLFVPAAQPVTSTVIYYNLNISAADLYDTSTVRLYVYYSTSQTACKSLTVRLYSAEYDTTDVATQADKEVFSEVLELTNGTYRGYLDISAADLLYVMSYDNPYNAPHLSIVLYYPDSGDEFVEGEQIDFQFTFQKQRGVSESALTPYIVGGLGVFLMVSAAASTDIIDPTSPYHVINNPFKKKRAPRGRRKTASRRRKTTRKRRR